MKRCTATQTTRFTKKKQRTGAALYTLVVFNAFLLGMLGLSALTISRVERRQNRSSIDVVQSRRLASAGIELAKLQLDRNKNWRTLFTHNVLSKPLTTGSGTIRFQFNDPSDKDLSDNAADGITITAVANFGNSTWSEEVSAIPIQGPPEFLKMAMHAGGEILIGSSAQIQMNGAPISTNGHLQLDGKLQGDAECLTTSGFGLMNGMMSTNQAPKALPLASVFADYQKLQPTVLSYQGDMSSIVLGLGVNTYGGATNPEGLYYINPGKSTISIVGSRIDGTLLIDGNASIDVAAYIKNFRTDFPVMIVRGNLAINLESRSTNLKESDYSTNFNPPGAEYLGSSDSDQIDVYPNRIEGFIHVTGALRISGSPTLNGSLVCEGLAQLNGSFSIQHDATLFTNPPLGYEQLPGPQVEFVPNSWMRVPVPQ